MTSGLFLSKPIFSLKTEQYCSSERCGSSPYRKELAPRGLCRRHGIDALHVALFRSQGCRCRLNAAYRHPHRRHSPSAAAAVLAHRLDCKLGRAFRPHRSHVHARLPTAVPGGFRRPNQSRRPPGTPETASLARDRSPQRSASFDPSASESHCESESHTARFYTARVKLRPRGVSQLGLFFPQQQT
jgi:hypothetical protein